MFKKILIVLILVMASVAQAAEVKISALPEVTSVAATDVLPLNASGATSKIQMVNLGVPGAVGGSGSVPRGGGAGILPGWSTFTIADTFSKGSFLYNATANTVGAFAHPGAANYLLATNAADTAAWFASSAAVITILGSADAATFRSNAGLAIGTNVQAASAILLGIAATTPAAGLLGYTGAAYDWYTGISLSNNSLRHFYDEVAGYYSNSDCTGFHTPALCCNAAHPDAGNTCAPKYVGIDPVGMTGTKSAKLAFQNTADAIYTFPVATGSLANIASSISDSDLTHCPDGNSVFDALALKAPLASPTFTGPVLGIATGTSLAVTGNLSGLVGVITKSGAYTLGTDSAAELNGYMMLATATMTLTLPDMVVGQSFCAMSRDDNEVLTIDANAGDSITLCPTAATCVKGAAGATVVNTVAAADGAGNYICFLVVEADNIMQIGGRGTWSAP